MAIDVVTLPPGLHLGDGVAWLENQPDDSLDGLFTDPPWGAGPDIAGQRQWVGLIVRVLVACERVVKPAGNILIWYGAGVSGGYLPPGAAGYGVAPKCNPDGGLHP